MNNQRKRAGQSTREMAAKRHKNRIWYSLLAVVILLLILLIVMNPKLMKVGGVGSIGLLIAARLIMNYSDVKDKQLRKEEQRAVRGAQGEETIGSILARIGNDYLVIHDVASPYGNIDHVVISKEGGIFLVETKAHGGKVSVNKGCLLVNGHDPEKDFIAQTLSNTYWFRDTVNAIVGFEPWIIPVLVFTNAFVEPGAPLKGVKVVNKKFLLGFLHQQNKKPQNLVIWENREKIEKVLCAS